MITPLAAAIFGALLGAAVGSFLGCAWYRVPRKISLSARRSFCPGCQQPVRWYWNVPVFSWLLLRGKSRCCQQHLAVSYLLLELAGLFFGALSGYLLGIYFPFALALLVLVIGTIWELAVIGRRR